MRPLAFDTSAAIPLLLRSHTAHEAVRRYAYGRAAALTTHSLAETYSVLTRLPGDARVAPWDAVRLLESGFPRVLPVPRDENRGLPRVLAARDLAGGAVYDALVGLAARAAALPLLTRDARALSTYRALGVDVELVPA
ncbi:PIN domain-containing protein [Geodermatophilus marinus]|uniref:PIN domain-containing protein n=1 Tax=Geodermatophilus sp. LHW52908 TaxID=2303986 RepID=UPI000E3B5FE0|nr:PIN domain-containing protein [Geodermatophilus sp. LHW52908]RFU21320.1 PIN domain-containing protein [Geodermatophilus sp. LHW52908]